MNKYIITIEETISESFEVLADTDEEAENIAVGKYKAGEFVLSPGYLVTKQMEVDNITDGYSTEWFEF